jgi:hypothetical protein
VDLETRLLIVSHLQGVCMHFMLTEEIERRKLELGRELSHDDLDVVIDQVMRKRNGIEEIAKSQREELEDLVSKLGKHARPAPAKSPAHLLYIA